MRQPASVDIERFFIRNPDRADEVLGPSDEPRVQYTNIRNALRRLGFETGMGHFYDTALQRAIRDFQRKCGHDSRDGRFGPRTRALLSSKLLEFYGVSSAPDNIDATCGTDYLRAALQHGQFSLLGLIDPTAFMTLERFCQDPDIGDNVLAPPWSGPVCSNIRTVLNLLGWDLEASYEYDDSLKAADEVERLEEKVDDLHQKARSYLSDIKSDGIHVGSIILLGEFIDAIENTADRCEDTCDQVRVMAVTLSKRKD